jgi:hypothetical protein
MAVAPWIVSDEPWELIERCCRKRSGAFAIRGVTCWRRLEACQRAGVCGRSCMRCCWRVCGLRVSSNGRGRSPTRARCRRKGGSETGPSPVERGRPGCKHHLLVDATGIPLAFSPTGGNRNDVTQLIPLLDGVPPCVARSVGRAAARTR